MTKITNAFFNSKELAESVELLSNCRAFTPIKALKIMRFCREISKMQEQAQMGFVKITKDFCILEESGIPKGFKEGKYEFETPEKKQAYNKAFDEFMNAEVEIDVPLLSESDLHPAQLAPKHLGALELFLKFAD